MKHYQVWVSTVTRALATIIRYSYLQAMFTHIRRVRPGPLATATTLDEELWTRAMRTDVL